MDFMGNAKCIFLSKKLENLGAKFYLHKYMIVFISFSESLMLKFPPKFEKSVVSTNSNSVFIINTIAKNSSLKRDVFQKFDMVQSNNRVFRGPQLYCKNVVLKIFHRAPVEKNGL
jgi:hypothetical protein